MPLSISVGLSRKASRDYQSTGVSINVTAELDQSLLAKPAVLQQQIDNLYSQAEEALGRHAGSPTPANPPASQRSPINGGNGRYGRNGDGNGNGRGQSQPASMTVSQRRAITAIAGRLGIDPAAEAHDVIGVDLDGLTVPEASQLIDHLKSLQPAHGRATR